MKCLNCSTEIKAFTCVVDADPEGKKFKGVVTKEVFCSNCAPNQRVNAIVDEEDGAVRAHILTQEELELLQKLQMK